MGLLSWLEAGFVGTWVRESLWGYAILLTLHSLGMAFLVGTTFVIALSILRGRGIAAAPFARFMVIVWAGFIVSALSGIALFSGQATSISASQTFLIKMALVVLGVVLTRRLARALVPESGDIDRGAGHPQSFKLMAGGALAFWVGVIVAGRLTAYLP